MSRDLRMLLGAIDDLVERKLDTPVAASSEVAPTPKLSKRTFSDQARQQIVRRGMLPAIESALTRAPIRARLMGNRRTQLMDPLWIADLGDGLVKVCVAPDSLSTTDVQALYDCQGFLAPTMVVSEHLPDAPVIELFCNPDEPNPRLLITAEALIAGSLFVQLYQEHLRSLIQVFLGERDLVIDSFSSLRQAMLIR